jgi:hypothetical protein
MLENVYNALLAMRRHFLLLLGLGFALGCASEPEVRPAETPRRQAKKAKHNGWATGGVAGDDKAMGMEMSVGYLDEYAVDHAIRPHERAMASCFSRAGDARKYLSGKIVMRFVVAASGEVADVQVIKNDLGSYPVESCLVLQGKRIVFPAPEGRRGTDFEYSMNFTSTGERSVVPWSGEEMARHMNTIASDLANCGELGNSDIDVIAYVEPGGAIGSVGFASQTTLDPTAAICAVALMRKVRIIDAPASAHSSVVLRATFPMTLAFERSAPIDTHKLSKRSKRH